MRDLTVFRLRLETRLAELMEHLNREQLARAEERERQTQREVTDTKDMAFRAAVEELAGLGCSGKPRNWPIFAMPWGDCGRGSTACASSAMTRSPKNA